MEVQQVKEDLLPTEIFTQAHAKQLFQRHIGKVEKPDMKALVVPAEMLALDGEAALPVKELTVVQEVELFGSQLLKILKSQQGHR